MALYLLYFALFSIAGWIVEVAFSAIKHGRFVNRGFNSGPVCPIYGFCIALLRLILHPIAHTWVILYLSSVLLATVIELATGFLMDKLFGAKWWDYSSNKLNIGGYVCLSFSLIWGGFCMLIAKVFFPLVDGLYAITPTPVLYAILAVFLLLLLLDFVASITVARGLDKHLKLLNDLADILKTSSDRLGKGVYTGTKKVEALYRRVLEKTPLLYRRIVDAFPTMRTKYSEQLALLRERIHRKGKKAADAPALTESTPSTSTPPPSAAKEAASSTQEESEPSEPKI